MTAMSNWNWTMEHYPNSVPMRRGKRFDFEAFDALIDEALSDLPEQPAQPDNVVDLNANVEDLFPPPEAA